MSRLASLRGPSTPSPASSRSPPLSPTSPASKLSALDPTPFHRKTRSIMTEVEKALKDWEDVVLVDGIRAGQGCIDARTELDNISKDIPQGWPPSPLASSLLAKLSASDAELTLVLQKLEKRFSKFAFLAESADQLELEGVLTKGPAYTATSPLWTTWPLARFVEALPRILSILNHSYARLVLLAARIQDPATSFDVAKDALEAWQREGYWEASTDGEGRKEFTELMVVEVKGWELGFQGKGLPRTD